MGQKLEETGMNWVIRLGIVLMAAATTAFGQCMDSLWRVSPGVTGLSDIAGSVANTPDGNIVVAGYEGQANSPMSGYGVLRKIAPATGTEQWSHQYSGMGNQDIFLDVWSTNDGGYVCAGWSRNPTGNWQHYWLLKTNANGDSLWSKNFGTGAHAFQGRCVVQTQDGGYALGGRAHSVPGGHGNQDWMIIKTNANGDSLWSLQLGDSLEDTMTDMILSANGTIVAFGYSDTDSTRMGMIAGISQNGQVMWQRTYDFEAYVAVEDLVELPDGGGYMACGAQHVVNGDFDPFIMETGANGARRWHQTLDLSEELEELPLAIGHDGQGGWYLTGNADFNGTRYNIFTVHVSSCGEVVSTRWLEDDQSLDERLNGGTVTPGGQIISCGYVLDTLNERSWLLYGFSFDTCNAAPCGFERLAPEDSSLQQLAFPIVFNWSQSTDPDGDDIRYIFQLEHNYQQEAVYPVDTVVTDTFVHVQIDVPVSPLDELFDFRWRVWATDGVDTIEAWNEEGYFQMDITLSSDEVTLTPQQFALSAYPNPFNPTTTISYSIDKQQAVTLELFDVQGRLVKTLVNEIATAGAHTISFDGSNLSSGLYFANLRAGDNSRVTKLVLMK
jgi:hypothetical protein